MPRFFVDPGQIVGQALELTGEDAHHLQRVLRLGPGASVTALDGSGACYEAVVETVEKDRVTALITGRGQAPEPPLAMTLYQGLPKGDKWELVIQKATELGATRLVPVAAARSVTQIKGDKAESKRERWRKIAKEAAEQCERGRVPDVTLPVGLEQIALAEGVLGLVLSERVAGPTLPRALPEGMPREVAIFVGPEGGWTPAELDALRQLGAIEVSLGRRILRTETAGLAALAMVIAAYEL